MKSAAHPWLLSNYEIKHDSYPKHRSGMKKQTEHKVKSNYIPLIADLKKYNTKNC